MNALERLQRRSYSQGCDGTDHRSVDFSWVSLRSFASSATTIAGSNLSLDSLSSPSLSSLRRQEPAALHKVPTGPTLDYSELSEFTAQHLQTEETSTATPAVAVSALPAPSVLQRLLSVMETCRNQESTQKRQFSPAFSTEEEQQAERPMPDSMHRYVHLGSTATLGLCF